MCPGSDGVFRPEHLLLAVITIDSQAEETEGSSCISNLGPEIRHKNCFGNHS